MKYIKKAFTLVELVVVITILSILATITFVSYGLYTSNARDSVRISDIENIDKSLNLFNIEHWFFPEPDGSYFITYSWSIAWTQWYFWEDLLRKTQELSKVPVDPLTGSNYAYSVTNNKKEVQFASILENQEIIWFSNVFWWWIAAPWKELWTAYVKWNYNWKFVKVSTWSTIFVLGVPSILTSDILSVDLQNIYSSKNFVYDWYYNIPHTYNNTNLTLTGWFNFNPIPNTPVLFEWNEAELATWIWKLTFAEKLKNFYIDTILENNQKYENIVDLNPLVNSDEAIALVNTYMSNNVWWLKSQKSLDSWNYSISNILDFEKEWGYLVTEWLWNRVTTEKNNWNYSLELTNWTDYSGEYTSCITVNQKLDYNFSVNLYAKSNDWGSFYVSYNDWYNSDTLWFSPTNSWKDNKSYILSPWTYDFYICYISNNQADSLFLDDISFDYTVDGVCSYENNSSFYDVNDIVYMCDQWVSTNIIDQWIWQKFTWSCQWTLWWITENCSADHIWVPNNIIDFETDTWYTPISWTWTHTDTDNFHWDYSLNSWVNNSCLTISKTINSKTKIEFASKVDYDTNELSWYMDDNYTIKLNGDIILGKYFWNSIYNVNQINYSNWWIKTIISWFESGNYEIEYCIIKWWWETGSVYFDYVAFDSNGLCWFNNWKSASVFSQAWACKNWNLANYVDNWQWSTYNWDCDSLDWWNSVSCSMNHIAALTTYPWCDSPDIYLWDTIISSCNVWTNISWTWVSSYWWYFQWWRNKMFATSDSSQRATTIPWITWLNAATDTYDFVWSDTLPWSWSDDNIDDNWGWFHWYTWDSNYEYPTEFTNQQGPCASWYHVPDSVEWSKVAFNWGWVSSLDGMSNNWSEMANLLKLPYVWWRSGYDWSLMMVWTHGCYWSSDNPNYNLTIADGTLIPNSWWKGSNNFDWLSVRCFKN